MKLDKARELVLKILYKIEEEKGYSNLVLDEYIKKQKLLYAIIFWSCVVFALGITIFSNLIINILYGAEYLGAKNALIISAWYPIFAQLGSARNTWIVINNKNKYSKKYVFWGAVVNFILNSILIPKYGIDGAAIATLITQIVVAIVAPLIYKETRITVKHIFESIVLKGII